MTTRAKLVAEYSNTVLPELFPPAKSKYAKYRDRWLYIRFDSMWEHMEIMPIYEIRQKQRPVYPTTAQVSPLNAGPVLPTSIPITEVAIMRGKVGPDTHHLDALYNSGVEEEFLLRIGDEVIMWRGTVTSVHTTIQMQGQGEIEIDVQIEGTVKRLSIQQEEADG